MDTSPKKSIASPSFLCFLFDGKKSLKTVLSSDVYHLPNTVSADGKLRGKKEVAGSGEIGDLECWEEQPGRVRRQGMPTAAAYKRAAPIPRSPGSIQTR